MSDATNAPVIHWFRWDLRLADNPSLAAAFSTGRPVICLYIFDEGDDGLRPLGGASKWWLDKSLASLADAISKKGGRLILRRGNAQHTLDQVIAETGATGVQWNRRYAPDERVLDEKIKTALKDRGVDAKSFNGSLLTDPWTFETGSGGHYRVFTPYWKAVQAHYKTAEVLPTPTQLASPDIVSDALESWNLHPDKPDWSTGFTPLWNPGEDGAHLRLSKFIESAASRYDDDRNRPDIETGTSGLSPHLRFGEISPVHIWRAVKDALSAGLIEEKGAMTFLSEIVWREFSYVLLFHQDDLAGENYNRGFDHMEWREAPEDFKAWCKGETGYPIVDAGMRQLWQTGWMHNRVRMIVASFLTKHLLIDWRLGEKWFWDTLVDADAASNPASWQWVAGSGADAAPYFRVFNPITQGEKFDQTGAYVLKYCPELSKIPKKFRYQPWEMKTEQARLSGIKLGETYPRPIVSHRIGRERALAAYEIMKQKRDAT
ncbi:MAG: deoxyribodipyrimidine photo-lyase [Pseudomonadota bacterium]